jgi:hypothetical protein
MAMQAVVVMVIVPACVRGMVMAPEAEPVQNLFPHSLLAVVGLQPTRSQVFGDCLEFFYGLPLFAADGPNGVLQAMVDVILDQGALRLGYRLLDGVQLLGDIQTGPMTLDHGDDASQMSFGPFEPLDDFGVGLVNVICHGAFLSPWRGYFKPPSFRRHVPPSRPGATASRIGSLGIDIYK